MRVVCDNCGATYKIPESKLTKDTNKATCRKCGHRMMIRRAAPAVGGPAGLSESNGEHTMLRRSPVPDANPYGEDGPTRLQGPAAEERPTVAVDPPAPPAAPLSWSSPQTVPVASAVSLDKPAPASAGPTWSPPAPVAAPPAPVVAPAAPPAPVMAAAAPVAAPAPPVAAPAPPVALPQAAPPAPVAAPAAPAAPAAHDPSGDLTFALLGALGAAAGALLLGLDPGGSAALRGVGLFVALAGSLLAVFVLVTGARGTRAASTGLALGAAVLLAAGGAGGTHALRGLFESAPAEVPAIAARPAAAPAPAPAPAPVDAAADAAAADAAADALAAVEEPVVAEAAPLPPPPAAAAPPPAAVAAAPRPAPAAAPPAPVRGSGSDVAAASSTSSRSTPPPAPAPPPPPPPAPAATKMSSLPTNVVQTIVNSNKGVKKCFLDEKKASGSLPPQVVVKFTVDPSGKVTRAQIDTADFKGTDFDVCLGGAFRSMVFPPFDGEPVTMKYPFVL